MSQDVVLGQKTRQKTPPLDNNFSNTFCLFQLESKSYRTKRCWPYISYHMKITHYYQLVLNFLTFIRIFLLELSNLGHFNRIFCLYCILKAQNVIVLTKEVCHSSITNFFSIVLINDQLFNAMFRQMAYYTINRLTIEVYLDEDIQFLSLADGQLLDRNKFLIQAANAAMNWQPAKGS